MSKANANQMQTITPHLVCAKAIDAIEFYKKAFGATESVKLVAPNGGLIHACLKIGDSNVMLAEECPEFHSFGPSEKNLSPVVIHLMVPDVDAVMARAASVGAKITMPAADMFWGDRYGQLVDPFGHRWSVATHQRDLSPEEIQEAAAKACGPQGN